MTSLLWPERPGVQFRIGAYTVLHQHYSVYVFLKIVIIDHIIPAAELLFLSLFSTTGLTIRISLVSCIYFLWAGLKMICADRSDCDG